MTNALTALAERVEAASGPSRELDAEVGRALSVAPKIVPVYKRGHYTGGDPVKLRDKEEWPRFTASIDAALTLVPNGWPKRLSEIRFGMWRVEMWQGDKSFKSPPDIDQVAASWPLAVCAAALRTRAA